MNQEKSRIHKSAKVMTVLNKTKHYETQPRQSPHLHQRQLTPNMGVFFLSSNIFANNI